TATIQARLGRSRVLGTKSLGTPDPGATSFALLMAALGEAAALDPRQED
ncbi:MAG: DAK2 domain-containing protein, partial [Propioniciclava sp.]